MRVQMKLGAAVVAALLVAATVAGAQARGSARGAQSKPEESRLVELGLDGGMSFGLDDPKQTNVGLPFQQLRAGFYLSPVISIEPLMSFDYNKTSQAGVSASASTLDLGVGMLWHLSPNRNENQWYLRPVVDMLHVSGSVTGAPTVSENQFALGGSVGVKVPMASRLATRLELGLQHRFEAGALGSQTYLGVTAGFSFFTR